MSILGLYFFNIYLYFKTKFINYFWVIRINNYLNVNHKLNEK